MPPAPRDTAIPDETTLTVALLGPDEQHRKAVAAALSGHAGLRLQEFSSFPPNVDRLLQKLAQQNDVVIIDVDSEPERAFELAEDLCASGRTYVMAYSTRVDMRLAVRFMRAGVREFFTLPLDAAEVSAALVRASTRRVESPPQDGKKTGKLFVFLGSKGGCGVTTLASNFALALAQESDSTTLLIDLGLPLGDVAINLGIVTEYSVAMALENPQPRGCESAFHACGPSTARDSPFFPLLTDLSECRRPRRPLTSSWRLRATSTPWHFLYFFPLPQGQGSLRPTLSPVRRCVGSLESPPPCRLAAASSRSFLRWNSFSSSSMVVEGLRVGIAISRGAPSPG
jgi:FixJ family two-component response regulator